MTFVAVNVIAVPADRGGQLEQRFAHRAGMVERSEGFEGFELLRPLSGTTDYLVITRWRSEADFTAWRDSQDFRSGHASAAPAQGRPTPATADLWTFEVAQATVPHVGQPRD